MWDAADPLTILRVHEVMEELGTVDHHNFTNIDRLPAGQVVPHPRTHWGDERKHKHTEVSVELLSITLKWWYDAGTSQIHLYLTSYGLISKDIEHFPDT